MKEISKYKAKEIFSKFLFVRSYDVKLECGKGNN